MLAPGRWCYDKSQPVPDHLQFMFPMAVLEVKLSVRLPFNPNPSFSHFPFHFTLSLSLIPSTLGSSFSFYLLPLYSLAIRYTSISFIHLTFSQTNP